MSHTDWLFVRLQVTPRRVHLREIAQLRWDTGPPQTLDGEAVEDGPASKVPRWAQQHAVERLAQRWESNLPAAPGPAEQCLVKAGFVLARRLLRRGFLAQLMPGDLADTDVAVALATEEVSTVLERMDGRCRPESVIARYRPRWGVDYFELSRTSRP